MTRGWSEDQRSLVSGLAVLVVGTALGLMVFANAADRYDGKPLVTAELSSIGDGLPPGSDVKFRGVLVGQVAKVDVTRLGENVRVVLALEPRHIDEIPSDVVVRRVPSNIFSQPALELTALERTGAAALTAGDVVHEDRSRGAVELQSAIEKAYQLLDALNPQQLTVVLDTLAGAFDGNGKELGAVFARADRYLGRLNGHSAQIDKLLRDAADAVSAVRDVAPDLLAAVDDALVPARTIAQSQAQFRALLSGGTDLVDLVGPLLEANRERLISVLHETRPVLGALGEDRDAITGSFTALGEFASWSDRIEQGADGPVVRIVLTLQSIAGLPSYTAANCPVYAGTAGVPAMRGRNCNGPALVRVQ
ncbi:MAG TPA: MCE family protein [Nocardioidaceae bacterium]|nr:MCE family protein [Nocardioidaceae bacterium]